MTIELLNIISVWNFDFEPASTCTQYDLTGIVKTIHESKMEVTVVIPARDALSTIGGFLDQRLTPLVSTDMFKDLVAI